jgi:hypothetical protein
MLRAREAGDREVTTRLSPVSRALGIGRYLYPALTYVGFYGKAAPQTHRNQLLANKKRGACKGIASLQAPRPRLQRQKIYDNCLTVWRNPVI